MDLAIPDELRQLQLLVRKFVNQELMPLEKTVIQREASIVRLYATEMLARVADRASKSMAASAIRRNRPSSSSTVMRGHIELRREHRRFSGSSSPETY